MDNKEIKTKLDNKELEEVAGGARETRGRGIASYKKVEPYSGVCQTCKKSKMLAYKNGSIAICETCYSNLMHASF